MAFSPYEIACYAMGAAGVPAVLRALAPHLNSPGRDPLGIGKN